MAVTNVKSTFLAKLLGQTNDKKNLPEELIIGKPAAGRNPGLRFQNESDLFGPQGIGATPQPQAPQQAQRSRYNLFEMTQSRPTRDTESEEIIKKRARINALGAGISGLAGLASMKMGGDVADPVDLVTHWNMDQTRMLDQDYRGRLQNWIDQGFQVDQANTQLQNQEIDQNIDAENRMQQIQQQGENSLAGIEARLAADMEKFKQKSRVDQMKEMQDKGIDFNSPTAQADLLKFNRKKAQAELNYINARTGYNNRYGSGKGPTGSGSGKDIQYSLSTLKKGRDAKISQLQTQKAAAVKSAKTTVERAEIEQYYNELILDTQKFKPGSNPLTDAEIAELGFQMEEQEMRGGTEDKEAGSFGFPFTPGQGINMQNQQPEIESSSQPIQQAEGQQQPKQQVQGQKKYANISETERMKAMNNNAQNVIRNAQVIASIDLENPDPKTSQLIRQYAQELVDLGVIENANSPEEALEIAAEIIYNLALKNAQQ